jgi:chorismate mutase
MKRDTILIGNGSKLMDYELGSFIDTFNNVVRFNAYTIQNYEKKIGNRINTFFVQDMLQDRIEEHIDANIDIKFYNPLNRNIRNSDIRQKFLLDHSKLNKIKTHLKYSKKQCFSTGFCAIVYYLFLEKKESIVIANIDFQLDKTRPVEYFNKNAQPYKGHNFRQEKQFVQEWKSTGKIIELEDICTLNFYIPQSIKFEHYYKYIISDIYWKNDKIYCILPVYHFHFLPVFTLSVNNEKLSYSKIFNKNIKNSKAEPCCIVIYDYSSENEKIIAKIEMRSQVYNVILQNDRNIKNKYKLTLTTLFLNDFALFDIFYKYYTKQGVEYFYMYYNGEINNEIKYTFSKYSNVLLIEWNFKYWNDNSAHYRHHAQPMQLHHAIYYFGHYSEYMIFCDLDEYMHIPESTIIEYINKNSDIDVFGFRNIWAKCMDNVIPITFPQKFLISKHVDNYKYRSKNIFRLQSVETIGIHHGDVYSIKSPKIITNLAMFHFSNWSKPDRNINCTKFHTLNCNLPIHKKINVFIVGDSHMRIFKNICTYNEKFNFCLKIRSQTTMFRVQRDGIEDLLSPNHERSMKEMESTNVHNAGDVFLFSFGYVDIINNILRHNSDWKNMVNTYLECIIKFSIKYCVRVIVHVDTVVQPDDLSHTHFGSLNERTVLRNEVANFLTIQCKKKGVMYIKLYENILENFETFPVNSRFSDDNAHIGHSKNKAISCKGCNLCTGDYAKQIWNLLILYLNKITNNEQNILLVGNSNKNIENSHLIKNLINSFSNVVRFNNFSLSEKNTPYIGSKTDTVVVSNVYKKKKINAQKILYDPIFKSSSNNHIDAEYIEQIRKYYKCEMWFSTGLSSIFHYLKQYPIIYITNFDFCMGTTHYFDKEEKGWHHWETEMSIVQNLIEQKRVKVLEESIFSFIYTEPFTHTIIHNILPQNIYMNQMKLFETSTFKKFTHKPHRFCSKIEDVEFHKYLEYLKNYILSLDSIKKQLNIRNLSNTPSQYKWHEVVRCKDISGYAIEPHCDTMDKCISIIIYMNGKGSSTTLYSNDLSLEKNIEPIKNSCLLFVPISGKSWHSVEVNRELRYTIQMSLRKI